MKRVGAVLVVLVWLALWACSGNGGEPGAGGTAGPGETATASVPTVEAEKFPLYRSASGRAPNIVLILTDDQDAATFAFMPNLQRLIAAEGTTFPNFFSSLPLCCPSRATILRGQYAHNTGIWKNAAPDGGFQGFLAKGLETSTVATWLQGKGYRTALMGKYLNQYPADKELHVAPGWDEWHAFYGDVAYYRYTLNENGRLAAHEKLPTDYSTDVLAAKAEAFIREATGQPFFLYLAPYAPHGPSIPAGRHSSTFPGVVAPRPPSFDEEDVSDKPVWIVTQPRLEAADIAAIDADYRKRLQTLQAADEMIARVVQALAETGQLEETFIFVTSDNGWEQGEHRLEKGKQSPYEESIRVSMFVRGPGVPVGLSWPHLVGNVDLAPTLASLAGVEPPGFVDGRSLLPLLGASVATAAEWRQAFLIEGAGSAGGGKKDPKAPPFAGLRMAGRIYIEYETGERELYDLERDPHQLQNLADVAPKSMIEGYRDQLRRLRGCGAQACRDAER